MPSPPLRILIVEDHMLITKQVEMIAASAGHIVVGAVATGEEACTLACTCEPDIVFLDVSLRGQQSGLDVARYIAERSEAHVVFTTANKNRLPEDFCGAIGVIEKPFTRNGLLSALIYIAARIQNAIELPRKPDSLQLSPAYERCWLKQSA